MPNLLPPSERRAWQAEISEDKTSDIHGDRFETRHIFCTDSLASYLDWPGAKQVCKLIRTRQIGDTETRETAYAITSLSPDQASAKKLMQLWRKHWHIENRLHWVRDNTFHEDACQVKSGHAPQLLASLRNLVISLLNLQKTANFAAAQRSHALNPEKCFAALGIQGFT